MTNALVIYHTLYGNTKTVAMNISRGIEELKIASDCLSVDEVSLNQIASYDFLAIGSPTHAWGPSKPMKQFLSQLKSADLQGTKGFSFDTRMQMPFNKPGWGRLENSAAKRIQNKMERLNITIIKPRESAIVAGKEGPLAPSMETTFRSIGKEIGKILA